MFWPGAAGHPTLLVLAKRASHLACTTVSQCSKRLNTLHVTHTRQVPVLRPAYAPASNTGIFTLPHSAAALPGPSLVPASVCPPPVQAQALPSHTPGELLHAPAGHQTRKPASRATAWNSPEAFLSYTLPWWRQDTISAPKFACICLDGSHAHQHAKQGSHSRKPSCSVGDTGQFRDPCWLGAQGSSYRNATHSPTQWGQKGQRLDSAAGDYCEEEEKGGFVEHIICIIELHSL